MSHRPLTFLAAVLLAAGAPTVARAQNSSSPAATPASSMESGSFWSG